MRTTGRRTHCPHGDLHRIRTGVHRRTEARPPARRRGRPTVVNADSIRAARDMLPNPEHSITSIAKLLGVSPGTLYNHIPDLQELRTGRVPTQLDGGTR
ncbi:helix-turn-helix domain-containing protein [Streptomyces sp. NPDC056930]|uniref:helix-turn-helix domain-containing protein n=1 Tax=Streptomyces sp. NPDC056930 TaxID=3345967 RepID=UPI00363CCF58